MFILTGVYHAFYDDTGNIHYAMNGILWLPRNRKHYSLLAKYAYYNADQYSTDTQKIWVQVILTSEISANGRVTDGITAIESNLSSLKARFLS